MFASVSAEQLDAVCVAAMMKGLVDGAAHTVALEVYQRWPALCGADDFCTVLAIKACIGCGDFARGKRIIDNTQHLASDGKPHLNNITMALYAESGEVSAAEAHFVGIAPRPETAPCAT